MHWNLPPSTSKGVYRPRPHLVFRSDSVEKCPKLDLLLNIPYPPVSYIHTSVSFGLASLYSKT